jgi:hypothetical protein
MMGRVSFSRRTARAAVGLVLSTAFAAGAQQMPWQQTQNSGGKQPETVHFDGPEQVELSAGRPQTVEMRFHVADGFHINSHVPHAKSLIPTQLMVLDGNGVTVSAVDFPPGSDLSLSFAPEEKLSVYTGAFTLRAHLTATPGTHELEGALRYQACTANACLPPRKIPITVSLLAR